MFMPCIIMHECYVHIMHNLYTMLIIVQNGVQFTWSCHSKIFPSFLLSCDNLCTTALRKTAFPEPTKAHDWAAWARTAIWERPATELLESGLPSDQERPAHDCAAWVRTPRKPSDWAASVKTTFDRESPATELHSFSHRTTQWSTKKGQPLSCMSSLATHTLWHAFCLSMSIMHDYEQIMY